MNTNIRSYYFLAIRAPLGFVGRCKPPLGPVQGLVRGGGGGETAAKPGENLRVLQIFGVKNRQDCTLLVMIHQVLWEKYMLLQSNATFEGFSKLLGCFSTNSHVSLNMSFDFIMIRYFHRMQNQNRSLASFFAN